MTTEKSKRIFKVFLIVDKGRIAGDILFYEKTFNHIESREDIKIFKRYEKFKENCRIQEEMIPMLKEWINESTHRSMNGSSFLKSIFISSL